MDPLLFNFFSSLTLQLIHEFKGKDTIPTEEEIKERFESGYAAFLEKNKTLQDETKD